MSNPASPASAAAVYESRPPLSRTTALLDAADISTPDMFVNLKLKSNRQPVGENPRGQLLWAHHPMNRREEHRRAAPIECVPRDDVTGELVVGSILNDELHLVARPQPIDVAPFHAFRLAARRALH